MRELQRFARVKLYLAILAAVSTLPALAHAEEPAPSAPRLTLEAVLERTGQALVFDGDRDRYVLVSQGDAIGELRVTAVAPRQLVLSTVPGKPRHHFVLPLVAGPVVGTTAPAPGPAKPVGIPVAPTSEDPIDPYAAPEVVTAPAPAPPPATAPAPAPAQPAGETAPAVLDQRIAMARGEFDRALTDFTDLAKEIQVAREGDRVRIKEVARGSLFYRLGLRAGDVVVSVAEKTIADVDAAAEVYVLLKTVDRFTIKLYRGEQRTKIHVELKR